MSIHMYLAVKVGEITKSTEKRLAQVGFGLYPDGSVRIPERIIPDALAIIDDMNLPNFSNSAIELLKRKVNKGCILDFERQPNDRHIRLIRALSDKKIVGVPEVFHSHCPNALPMISCQEPCNNWLHFLRSTHKRFPDGWMLEITPWKHERNGRVSRAEGFLQNSLCHFRRENGKILYYDTSKTIQQKIILAERNGCRAALALYSELKQLET